MFPFGPFVQHVFLTKFNNNTLQTESSTLYLKGRGPEYEHDHGMPPTTPRNTSLWLPGSFMANPMDETVSTALNDLDNAD